MFRPAAPLLVILLFASGSAAAQGTGLDTVTHLDVPSPVAQFGPGAWTGTLSGTVSYTYPRAAVTTEPTRITLHLMDVPQGLRVHVEPMEFDVPVTPSVASDTFHTETRSVSVSFDGSSTRSGVVTIQAEAQVNGNLRSSSGEDQVHVKGYVDPEEHRPMTSAPGPASRGSEGTTGPPAPGLLVLAALGGILLLALRRKRA